jgi:hypothetical protein
MAQKPIKLKAVLPNGVELHMDGPDFSKLKCEHPPAETAVVLQRAEDDASAVQAIRTTHLLTLGIP